MAVAELLDRTRQKRPSTSRVVARDVEEVGVVGPNVRRLGSKLLDHGLEKIIRELLGSV